MAAIIEGQSLRKAFATGVGQVAAVDGVDVSVRAGDFLVIMGVSGSGKTTLLSLLSGLERPTSGTVDSMTIPPGYGRGTRTANRSGLDLVEEAVADALQATRRLRAAGRCRGASSSTSTSCFCGPRRPRCPPTNRAGATP